MFGLLLLIPSFFPSRKRAVFLMKLRHGVCYLFSHCTVYCRFWPDVIVCTYVRTWVTRAYIKNCSFLEA